MKSIPKQMRRAMDRLIKASAGTLEVEVQYSLTIPPGGRVPEETFFVRVGPISGSHNVWEIDKDLDVALLKALAKCKSLLSEHEQAVAALKDHAEKLGMEIVPKGGAR